jgi:DNA-binding SARP family transcriptional activator
MDFRLLGRLEVEPDGQRIELGRRVERALVGVLLLTPHTVIAVDRLMELLALRGC